jgi:hypothetical protein
MWPQFSKIPISTTIFCRLIECEGQNSPRLAAPVPLRVRLSIAIGLSAVGAMLAEWIAPEIRG